MTRYGMLINTKKCVGCSACRIACQMKNHLDPEESFIKYHEIETGEYPNVYNEIVPTQCMHCEDAPCAAVCPTHATYITDSCVVLVDEEKCIGCKYCMAAASAGTRASRAIRRRAWAPAFPVRACSATSTIPKATSLARSPVRTPSLSRAT